VTLKKAERLLICRDWTEETTMYPHLCEAVVDGGLGFDLRQVGHEEFGPNSYGSLPNFAQICRTKSDSSCNCINCINGLDFSQASNAPDLFRELVLGGRDEEWSMKKIVDYMSEVGGPWT
jgi:hypothetical protein